MLMAQWPAVILSGGDRVNIALYTCIMDVIVQLAGDIAVFISTLKAKEHTMFVSGFSCTQVCSISVIGVVLSGYRFIPLLVYSGLLL